MRQYYKFGSLMAVIYMYSVTDLGTAEFMPLKRESYVFHHATLDASPESKVQ